jgi:hypothetical protein
MRGRGGFIGTNVTPASAAVNSAASGVWTVREAESLKRAGTWPTRPEAPLTIAGLQLWLDAAAPETLFDATTGGSLVAADGAVARWEDKSGNGRHATQGVADERPVRKTSIQNGRGVLRFNGGASGPRMSIANSTSTFTYLHNGAGVVFLVACTSASVPDPNTLQITIDSSNAAAGNGYLLSFDDRTSGNANDSLFALAGAGASTLVVKAANNVCPPGVFKVITNTLNSTSATASERARLYFNGLLDSSVNSITGNTSGNSHTDLFIGASSNGFAPLKGDVAEILIYDAALSDANRSLVEQYLISKWAIT